MIWRIARKEFLLNLTTFKFAVGTILCIVLMAVFMIVLVEDYEQRLKDYNENVAANEAELRKVKVYKNITPTIYRPPSVLSVFSEGIEKQLGNSARIELGDVFEIEATSVEGNPLLAIFPALDVSLIFKIVMSILALLVAYDAISGERERGTLKLTLSGRVARHQLLLGKLLAGLLTLIVPFSVIFVIGTLILQFSPMVSLTGSDWARIGLMYLASFLFVAAIFNLGLLISCLTKRSSVSLMFSSFLWVILMILIPNGSVYLGSQMRPLEPAEKFDSQIEELAEEREREIDELTESLEGGGSQSTAQGAFGHWYVLMCDENFMEYNQERYPITEPVMDKYADRVFEVQQSRLNSRIRQKYFIDSIARCSPMVLYDRAVSVLSGTDLGSFERFADNVRAYRNAVVDYIRSGTKDFSLPSYFTTSEEGEWEELMNMFEPYYETENETEKIRLMDTFKEWRERKIRGKPSLGLGDFPRFSRQSESVGESLRKAIPDLGLLIFISALFFAMSFVAFLRYDVT
jgi:ABC-type transport system involved in multi-copper enzyme maturation permease subunit